MSTTTQTVLELARTKGVITTRELEERGIAPMVLTRLVRRGALVRTSRGVYMHDEAPITEHHGLVEVAARVPHGLVCLLSALQFHEMSDEMPFQVWLAYERHKTRPRVGKLPVRLFVMSATPFHHGVETHILEGVPINITSPAKTVADCFKFRNQLGIDVCVAALRDYLGLRKGTRRALTEAADICRVGKVMRPYLEAM